MKLNKLLLPIVILGAIIAAIVLFSGSNKEEQVKDIYTEVKEGPFTIQVLATGEVKAKRSEIIRGPSGMQRVGVYQITIQNIIPEGTVVNQGDFVAQLDRTPLASQLNDAQAEIDKINTQLEQAVIDTTIDLRNIRDQIKDLEFTIQEKKLQLELNKYEPEAIRRQNEIDMEKAERDFKKQVNNLKLSKEKADAKIREILTNLKQQQYKQDQLNMVAKEFTITAPTGGMVIYIRNWNGSKQGPGSQISGWNPRVAELPDLSEMIVQAYVNEVDINKIGLGMDAKITVDALAKKEFSGQIIQVANIGENYRNYDSKVFEVSVLVNEFDSLLRPAMTAALEILTDKFEKAKFVPLDAIVRDSLSYVYVSDHNNTYKQEVILGDANEDEVILYHGVAAGTRILLSLPDDASAYPVHLLDPAEKSQALSSLTQERLDRQRAKDALRSKVKDNEITSDQSGGGNFIIF
ncbi:MAG: efflux RND transporter periplasmic adaptor subunit [Saprospiraceae bacterium]|nr:efflux RND transporter periplasmic adaptor subunit [Saprospiraceae bacterium]